MKKCYGAWTEGGLSALRQQGKANVLVLHLPTTGQFKVLYTRQENRKQGHHGAEYTGHQHTACAQAVP